MTNGPSAIGLHDLNDHSSGENHNEVVDNSDQTQTHVNLPYSNIILRT